MRNILSVLFFSFLLFICNSCSSNLKVEGGNDKSCHASPSERVLEYHTKLLQNDFVGANRLYSKRVLAIKLDNRKLEECKKTEDCLTARDRIRGFEVTIASGQSKILKENQTSETDRVEVLTDPPFPLSVNISYELIHEDGEWFIDKVLWENATVIPGFEYRVTPGTKVGDIITVPN